MFWDTVIGTKFVVIVYFWKLVDVYVFIEQKTFEIKNGFDNYLTVNNIDDKLGSLNKFTTADEFTFIFN